MKDSSIASDGQNSRDKKMDDEMREEKTKMIMQHNKVISNYAQAWCTEIECVKEKCHFKPFPPKLKAQSTIF